jgi:hypothetical protein
MTLRLFSVRAQFIACVLALLAGCGVGYVSKPGIIDITVSSAESSDQIQTEIARFLATEGFENLGRYDEMISLIQGSEMSKRVKEEELVRLNRERNFTNRSTNMDVTVADYSSSKPPKASFTYAPPEGPFIEINTYEGRPGGFSLKGRQFFSRLFSDLKGKFGPSVRIVQDLPPDDESEYWRVTLWNLATSIIWLSMALLMPLLLTGSLSVYLLRRTRFSPGIKITLFALINTWLVTPLPFQAASIMTIPSPNLLAFPWTNFDYYRRVASFAAISFPCTFVVCTIVSWYLFRAPSDDASLRPVTPGP